eukprot:3189091-Prymnesium_polylepis.1
MSRTYVHIMLLAALVGGVQASGGAEGDAEPRVADLEAQLASVRDQLAQMTSELQCSTRALLDQWISKVDSATSTAGGGMPTVRAPLSPHGRRLESTLCCRWTHEESCGAVEKTQYESCQA